MIALNAGVKVVVAAQPVDFRKGVHGLVALVAAALKAALRGCLCFPLEANGPPQAGGLGWHRDHPGNEVAGGWAVHLAADS